MFPDASTTTPSFCRGARPIARRATAIVTISSATAAMAVASRSSSTGCGRSIERGWPQDCRTRERPFVPERLINSMLDIMPSRRLIIHEYRKHGTCSGLSPEGYYGLSRRLFTLGEDSRRAL